MKNNSAGFRVVHEHDTRERPSSGDRLASFLRHSFPIADENDSADADAGDRAPVWVGWVLGAVLAVAGIALVTGAVALVVWLLGHLGSAAVGAASPLLASLGGWGPVQAITTPVRSYLTAHAAALPVTAETLWRAWATTGMGLLILSWTGSFGARVGWVLVGASTAAMVHAASPAHGAYLSTGITAIAWGVLSVLAFAGAGRSGPVIVERPEPPTRTDQVPSLNRVARAATASSRTGDDAMRSSPVFSDRRFTTRTGARMATRGCIGCGLAAETGDVYCIGCREAVDGGSNPADWPEPMAGADDR